MHVYRVGGAIRDRLLGLIPQETDWVVTGASVEDMLARGFRRLDPEIPVFAHPETGDEYALARRERKQAHGHKGFIFEYGPDVSLEEDLVRRDLTVNAMAEDDGGQLIDPHGGREDLAQRRLRHVSPAFVEDPLRVLRLARFAAQLADFGFAVVAETAELARKMSQDEDLLSLTPARRWRELARALACTQPASYLIHLDAFGALARLMPWLSPVGVGPVRVAGPAKALATASRESGDPGVRLAAACIAASRVGATGRPPDEWPLPREIRDLARLCVNHPLPDAMTPDAMLAWLDAVDAWRRGERLQRAVMAWRAALPGDDVRLAHLLAAADLTRRVRPPEDAPDPRLAVRRARLDIIAQMSVPVSDGP